MSFKYSFVHRHLLPLISGIPYHTLKGRSFSPLIVQIDLTYRCNLDCEICYQKLATIDTAKELTLDVIKKIVSNTPSYSTITFSGGEPFLRKDIDEILDFTLQKRRCNILTNGTLISKRSLKCIVEKKLFLLGISIDGNEEIHDKIRKKKGCYKTVIQTIKNIQDYKKAYKTKFPLIDIKTVITPENQSILFDILSFAEQIKADFFTLSLPKDSSYQFTPPFYDNIESIKNTSILNATNRLNLKILLNQLELIKNYKKNTYLRFYPFGMLNKNAIEKYINHKLTSSSFYPCKVPWFLICVSAYGDVYPCLSIKLGSMIQESMNSIWNGERFVNFRNQLRKDKIFPHCLYCCYLKYKGGHRDD